MGSEFLNCYCFQKCKVGVTCHIRTVQRHLVDDNNVLRSLLEGENHLVAEQVQQCIQRTEESVQEYNRSSELFIYFHFAWTKIQPIAEQESSRSSNHLQDGEGPAFDDNMQDLAPESEIAEDSVDHNVPPLDSTLAIPAIALSFLQNSCGDDADEDDIDADDNTGVPIEGFVEPETTADDENEDGDPNGDAETATSNQAEAHEDDLFFESAFFKPPPSVDALRTSLLGDYVPPLQPPADPFEVEPLDEEEKLSLQHYIAWRRTNGTVRAYNEHAAVLHGATGIDILSLYNVRKLAVRLARLYPKKIDMCPRSCIAYTGSHADLDSCPFVRGKDICGTPRYRPKGKKVANAQFTVLPVIPSIQALFANAETSRELRHRDSCLKEVVHLVGNAMQAEKEKQQFSDFGNGAVHRLHRRMGLFNESRDIAFACSSDGAQLTMKKQSNTWILILIILNLPATSRYKSSNIIINFSTPGPNAPGDIESFIWPLMQEFAEMDAGVWIWDAIDSAYFLHRAWIVMVLGDMLGSAKLSRLAGHAAFHGDRFSLVEGARTSTEKGAKAQYYPITPPENEKYNPTRPPSYDLHNLPRRSQIGYWNTIARLDAAKSKKAKAEISRDTGVVALPLCAASRAFIHPSYFPVDPFHLPYKNVLPFMWDTWVVNSAIGDPIHIPSHKIERFGALVVEAMRTLPPAFSGPVRNPHLKRQSQYKAYEWMALLHWYILPIGLELEFPPALLHNFSYLVEVIETAMTIQPHSISSLERLETLIADFLEQYETLYVGNDPEKIQRCRLCIFQLIHLPIHIMWYGSIRLTSAKQQATRITIHS
ncbi:hypothetical protein NMY22_g15548 [Coprinellus aureogranulatus]|nr:hypothetical protein NMY22_g15548 [Coprinellus aureogranulatus]